MSIPRPPIRDSDHSGPQRGEIRAGVLALLLAWGLMLAGCGGGDADSPAAASSLGTWAATYCGIAESLRTGVSAIPPVQALPFDERKQKGLDNGPVVLGAIDRALAGFDQLQVPPAARSYQEANADEARSFRKIYADSYSKLANAHSAQDIEALNADTNIALQKAREQYASRTQNVPADVNAALRGVSKCGLVS